jgi:serine/threonine protein kinase
MALQSGRKLQDRYQIGQRLGKGGMGAVYLAIDGRLGEKYVAIKEFDPAVLPLQDRQWAATAFEQEARMLAQLNHPALTAVTDYFTEHQLHYLVMEFVEGETLEDAWLRQPGQRFDPQQILIWARQLCDVLHYLHNQSRPVIFRDLKPDNIMVLPNGHLKLIDFGIARYFNPDKTEDTIALGTPGYAAPEQHGQAQADARTDIYALGVVLHQLLTGYDPKVTPFQLPPVRTLTPSVPAHMAHAIEQAAALNRSQRPESAWAFYHLLQPQNEAAPKATPRSSGPTLSKWVLAVAALLIVLSGIGLGIWRMRGEAEPVPVAVTDNTRTVPTPSATPGDNNERSVMAEPVAVTEEPVLSEVALEDAGLEEETPVPMCTPPACADNEVYVCAGDDDCPGGCGTICATVTPRPPPMVSDWEMARSAAGRSLPITQIGDGPRKIVLVGTVRGGESPDSAVLVNRLLAHFRDNPELVSPEVALYFIPVLNPDGQAAGQRFNVNGVDLNRNWDTPSWKSDTEQPGGTVRNSGGTRPFSEPETEALRNLLETLRAEGESVTVIAYHYHTGIPGQGTVQPGYHNYFTPVERSIELALHLAQAAGYSYLPYWDGAYIPSGELIQWCALNDIAAVDVSLPRGIQPDARPTGQTRTIFEAALASLTGLFD